MDKLSKEQKETILNSFGKLVIQNVRDRALKLSMGIVKQSTVNPVKLEQYSCFSSLNVQQQEAVCDLLSETITNVIYLFLEMFEDNKDYLSLIIKEGDKCYNMIEISEKMGSEIACYEDDGWVQKYSTIGRFVL